MATALQTTQRVTFTSIATILIPLGVLMVSTNAFLGVTLIVLGIGSLIARELFKSV